MEGALRHGLSLCKTCSFHWGKRKNVKGYLSHLATVYILLGQTAVSQSSPPQPPVFELSSETASKGR